MMEFYLVFISACILLSQDQAEACFWQALSNNGNKVAQVVAPGDELIESRNVQPSTTQPSFIVQSEPGPTVVDIWSSAKDQSERVIRNHRCGQNRYSLYRRTLEGSGITYASESLPNQFPWLVRIESGLTGRCNGVIVNERFVLTAAYCVQSVSQSSVTMHFGDLRSDATDDGEFTRVPIHIFTHPAYNNATAEFNLALLQLEVPLSFENSWAVQKICLPQSCSEDECMSGRLAVVASWGQVETGQYATNVKSTRMAIVPRSECHANWKADKLEQYVTADTMCAGTLQGPSMFLNDDGAPLMGIDEVKGKEDSGYFKLCGIHGMFKHNATDNKMQLYSTFSQVCSALPWIKGFFGTSNL